MGKYDSLIGKTIDKRYKIVDVIGEGGMAVVFKANDTIAKRVVAVKVLNESKDSDGQAFKRFLNESRAISMLANDNIVKIYDVSINHDPKYIVMELAEGKTLKDYMVEKGNKLPIGELLSYTEQILMALEHAHEKHVIHRDIKPHNMIVDKNGHLKVTDFGIAKTPSGDTITSTDKAMGTVYYISPEQASGKETGTFSDIYSLGVMMYEMATGVLPFDAESPVAVAMKQINEEPRLPSEIVPGFPVGLQQIILKAMAKNPEDRFRSAKTMLRAVRILKENPMTVFEEKQTEQKKEEPHNGSAKAKNVTGGLVGFYYKAVNFIAKKFFPEEIEDDRSDEDAEPSKVTLFPIILGITAAFFSVLFITAIILVSDIAKMKNASDSNVVYATVPSLVGKVYSDELKTSLEEAHFDVQVTYASDYNDKYGYGEIYYTQPAEGTVTKIKNSTMKTTLKLSVNPEEGSEAMQDYTIRVANTVKAELQNRGYENVKIVKEPHETVLENYIFKTNPEAGDIVRKDDEITLYVSTGTALKGVISMPDLVGKKKGDAVVALSGFNVEYIDVDSDKDIGTVLSQSVTAHIGICPEFTEKIVLKISNGSKSKGQNSLYLTMPDLVGKTMKEAVNAMEEISSFGIDVKYIEEENELPFGQIISQSIEPGAEISVNYDGEIKIKYSGGVNADKTETTAEETETAVEE